MKEDIKSFNIDNFDLNSHYSIVASAGTGKTFSMVNIVNKLKQANIKEDEILIVTYTEKAAGELKDRIKSSVTGFDINKAHIGTIHSFCKETIDEFYLTMGLPSNLNVVDENKMYKLYNKFIRDYIYENKLSLDDISGVKYNNIKDIVKLLYLNNSGIIDNNILSFPTSIASIGNNKNEILNYFKNYNKSSDKDFNNKVKETFELFDENSNVRLNLKNEIEKLNDKINDLTILIENKKANKEKILDDKKALTQLNKLKNEKNNYIIHVNNIFNSLVENIINNSVFNYNISSSNKFSEIKKVLVKLKEEFSDSINNYKAAAIDLYIKWQDEKQRNKWMTFNDMLSEVRESILNLNCNLKEKLQAKFKYALIDEFQDTNQIQWDIFKDVFLYGKNNHLIVVGDRKQSIYSFQGADLTVYDKANDEILKNNGKIRILPKNYRSSYQVITSYNKLFEMPSFSSLQYHNKVEVGNDKLYATFDGNIINGLSIVVKQENEEIKPIDPSSYALEIVKMISDYTSIINNKTRLQLMHKNDDGNYTLKNVKFSDFMILARTRSEFYYVENELKKVGIPYVKYKDNKLFIGYECVQVITLLNAINKSDFIGKNRKSFKKLLYTKFFEKSLNDISSSIYDSDSNDEIQMIYKWQELAKNNRYSELFDSIISDSEIEKRMNTLTDIQSLNVFKQILDYSLSYILQGNSLSDLIAHLTNLSNNNDDEDSNSNNSIIAKGNDFDCVQLMTMHASKGLDSAIVFSVAGEKKENKFSSSVGIYHENNNNNYESIITTDKNKLKEEISNEIDRLFYVAYTRAKFHLIIPYYSNNDYIKCINSAKEMLDDNNQLFDKIVFDEKSINAFNIKNNITSIINTLYPNINDLEKEKKQYEVINDISNKMNNHKSYKHSYSSMSKINENQEIIDENINFDKEGFEVNDRIIGVDLNAKYVDLTYDIINPLPIPNNFPKGAKIGNAFHKIFEDFDFSSIDNENNNLLYIIKKAFKDYSIIENDIFIEYVKSVVFNVLNAKLPIIKGSFIDNNNSFKLKSIDLKNKKAESEFNFKIENDILNNYCNGFIDLLFKKDDYYCILDWKSDTINDNDLLSYNKLEDIKKRIDGHYSIQRVLYAYTLIHYLYDCGLQNSYQEVFEKNFGGIYYVLIRGCNADSYNGIYAQTWENYYALENEFNKIIDLVKNDKIKRSK